MAISKALAKKNIYVNMIFWIALVPSISNGRFTVWKKLEKQLRIRAQHRPLRHKRVMKTYPLSPFYLWIPLVNPSAPLVFILNILVLPLDPSRYLLDPLSHPLIPLLTPWIPLITPLDPKLPAKASLTWRKEMISQTPFVSSPTFGMKLVASCVPPSLPSSLRASP